MKHIFKQSYKWLYALLLITVFNANAVEKGELKTASDFRDKLSEHDMSVIFFYSGADKNAKRNLKSFAEVSNRQKYDDAGVAFFQIDVNEGQSNFLSDLGVSGSVPVIVLFKADNMVKGAVLRGSFTKKSIASFIDANFGDEIDEAADSGEDDRPVIERRYYYYYGYDSYPYWDLGIGFGLGLGLGYGWGYGWGGHGWRGGNRYHGGGHRHGGGGHRHGGGGHHGGGRRR